MKTERLDPKLPNRERPHRLAMFKTRPPLLSSATRLEQPGHPGCARFAGAHAQPPFGFDTFSYSYWLRIHSSFPGSGNNNTQMRSTHRFIW
jgi:hypothetical protein